MKILNAGGHVYKAHMVSFDTTATQLSAYCDGIPAGQEVAARQMLHDSVVSICPGDNGEPGVVTLELTNGFSFGRPVLYVSTDASAEIAAALEGAIFVPAMGNIPVGRDDSLFSSIERGPLNVLGGIPTIATDYSPLWDLNLGEWTQDAIDNGYRSRLTEEFAILGMAERGFITGPGKTKEMADRIVELATDNKLRANMGARGKKRVEKLFSFEKNQKEILALLTGSKGY